MSANFIITMTVIIKVNYFSSPLFIPLLALFRRVSFHGKVSGTWYTHDKCLMNESLMNL